jgi:small subunit ribosomal protein S3
VGQKVHPLGLRLGIIKTWKSSWFAGKKDYIEYLHADLKMRDYIKKKLSFAGISDVRFERRGDKVKVLIHAARPGLIIGRKGSEVDKLKDELREITNSEVFVDIHEVKVQELDAQLVSAFVAMQLEKRASFRRVMKKAVTSARSAGALGVKIACAGRLGGAEMARTEGYHEGKVPLHTLRADIDYGFSEANTTYGVIGVKVWIFKGEIIKGVKETVKEK